MLRALSFIASLRGRTGRLRRIGCEDGGSGGHPSDHRLPSGWWILPGLLLTVMAGIGLWWGPLWALLLWVGASACFGLCLGVLLWGAR